MSLWDGWVRHPVGIALRILVGAAGVVFGFVLVFLAYFGATFKKPEPVWDQESAVLLMLGLAVAAVALLVAIRPSRRNALVALAVAVAVPLVGSAI